MKLQKGLLIAIGNISVVTLIVGYLLYSSKPTKSKLSTSSGPTHASSQNSIQTDSTNTTYALSDVKKHNSESDCWMVIDGKVYDVTSYIPDHPNNDIIEGCGKDATTLFDNVRKHMRRATSLLNQYFIGNLH